MKGKKTHLKKLDILIRNVELQSLVSTVWEQPCGRSHISAVSQGLIRAKPPTPQTGRLLVFPPHGADVGVRGTLSRAPSGRLVLWSHPRVFLTRKTAVTP